MKKITLLCLLLAGTLSALAGTYRPDEIPNVQRMDRQRYVSDPDGILSAAATARINSVCASLRERGLAQVAVVAVDDIAGGDAFSFAVELFRDWGVGSAKSDNGLGILLVKDLREIRFPLSARGITVRAWSRASKPRPRSSRAAKSTSAAIPAASFRRG